MIELKVKKTIRAMEQFASEGMRTMVYAYKEIQGVKSENVGNWRDEDFESNLTLLGVTGAEDKLQD